MRECCSCLFPSLLSAGKGKGGGGGGGVCGVGSGGTGRRGKEASGARATTGILKREWDAMSTWEAVLTVTSPEQIPSAHDPRNRHHVHHNRHQRQGRPAPARLDGDTFPWEAHQLDPRLLENTICMSFIAEMSTVFIVQSKKDKSGFGKWSQGRRSKMLCLSVLWVQLCDSNCARSK